MLKLNNKIAGIFNVKCLVSVIIFLIFISINGCADIYQYEPSKSCTLVNQNCTFESANGHTFVAFLSKPVVEEMITVQIDLPSTQQFEMAYVEGLNMEMGKTPFMVDRVEQNNDRMIIYGEIFMGSCTEPKMDWQLVFVVNEGAINPKENEKEQPLSRAVLYQTHQ